MQISNRNYQNFFVLCQKKTNSKLRIKKNKSGKINEFVLKAGKVFQNHTVIKIVNKF